MITETTEPLFTGGLRALSSVADDVWHADRETGAYEWWYFDAISDDGRDALVVIFLTNFIFSPRYNTIASAHSNRPHAGAAAKLVPAVAVSWYRDQRPVFRAVNEYAMDQFKARRRHPSGRIGRSSFELEMMPDGQSYRLILNEALRREKRFKATLTWKIIEGDFSAQTDATPTDDTDAHVWNLVAPRCRVDGAFAISSTHDGRVAEQTFSGTGYHDHNRDRRWLPATVAAWQWGRAHFDETTVVFYRYREVGHRDFETRLFIVRDGSLFTYQAGFEAKEMRRHHFGLRYPRAMRYDAINSDADVSLHLRQRHVIDGSYFYVRFLSDALLDIGDDRPRHAIAITEHLAPHALRWRWLDWLTNMRIGRNGRASFLP